MKICLPALLCAMACASATSRLDLKVFEDLKCDAASANRERLGEYLERVSCGAKTAIYGYDKATKSWRSPIERASFDLSCPAAEITMQHLGGREVGVRGCGKKAVYLAECINDLAYRGVVCNFSGWALNSAPSEVASEPNPIPQPVEVEHPQQASPLLGDRCEQANDLADCHASAESYELGSQVEKDRSKAIYFYGKACALGSKSDCRRRDLLKSKG